MRCVNCNRKVRHDATICRHCGGDPRIAETLRNRIDAVRKQAEEAAAAGRTVFVMRRVHRTALERFGEAINHDSQIARTIEAVEETGWRLDRMSHYAATHRGTAYEMSVYLFRLSSPIT